MAKLYNGFLGPFSGKVGNVIGCYGKNGFYIRSVSKKIKKAPSELQLVQRVKFGACSVKLIVFKEVLKIGFGDRKLNKNLSPYTAAFKCCLNDAIIGDYPNFDIDYSKLKMSRGQLLPLTAVSSLSDTSISLTWQNWNDYYRSFPDDKVYLICYNETRDECVLFDKAKRRDEQFSFSVERNPTDVLHLWVFCARYDGKVMSDSQYINLKSQ